jgi:hypothetical protein
VSYEGAVLAAGRRRFGAVPPKLIQPLLEAIGLLVKERRLREPADVEFLVQPAGGWTDLTNRLRRMAGLKTRGGWVGSVLTLFRRHLRRRRATVRQG